MGRMPDMPKCYDARENCFARTDDCKCFCLSSTYANKECPFYKTEDEVKLLVTVRDYKEAKGDE